MRKNNSAAEDEKENSATAEARGKGALQRNRGVAEEQGRCRLADGLVSEVEVEGFGLVPRPDEALGAVRIEVGGVVDVVDHRDAGDVVQPAAKRAATS